MPLLFILIGILFISNLFGVINFKYLSTWCLSSILSLLIMLGYLGGDIFVSNVNINIFLLVAVLISIGTIVYHKLILFLDIVCFVLIGILYYVLLDNNLSYMLGYDFDWAIRFALVLVSSIGYVFNHNMTFGFVSSLVITLISSFFGYVNYGVMDIDLFIPFEMVALVCALYVVRKYTIKLIYNNKVGKYEFVKKDNFCNNYSSARYEFFFG